MKVLVFDIDEVAVPQVTLDHARAGSNQAREQLKKWLVGVELKKGRGEVEDDVTVVSLRELASMGVVSSVVVK